jgi:hypothetical protein
MLCGRNAAAPQIGAEFDAIGTTGFSRTRCFNTFSTQLKQ